MTTTDEIIAMAREADPFGEDGRLFAMASVTPGTLERFAALVAAKEREACAKVADVHALGWQKNPGANPEAGFIASSNCAAAIRKRGAA